MITIENLNVKFNNSIILNNISYLFSDNLIYTILGPSGCGKTTLLNAISGLISSYSGSIEFSLNNNFVYMMQDDLLLPWRTLKENLTLGVEVLGLNNSFNTEVIDNFINLFDLKGYEDYYPDSLSGGMKQRASLIRSLACNPNLLLLDEPFSNLDFDIKLKIQKYLIDFYYKTESTFVLVTHDIEDAIALSDEVIVLSEKPTKVKKIFKIDLGIGKKNPIEARKSYKFRDYFAEIWDQLKYLDD